MKKNILIIEDVKAIREEIYDILTMEGYNVYEAENGKIAYQIAKEIKTDLIISDLIMPEMNGFELLKTLAKDKKTNQIPMILLSAEANKNTIKQSKKLGCTDYIIKPVSPDILLNIVSKKINICKNINNHIVKI